MPRYDLSRCLAQNRSAGYLSCVRCIGITDRCGFSVMWISVDVYTNFTLHYIYPWLCLRLVSASRLIRRLKREVDALLGEEPSWLQTLACSCRSSATDNGPSASNICPARPRVRLLTYLGLPCERMAP